MAKKFDVRALREKAMSTDDVIYDSVYVEAWDMELPIKSLTAPELKVLRKHKDDEIRMMILAVLHGCVTEDGERVFTDEDLAQFESGKKSFAPITEIANKVLEISGLSPKADKDAAKN